MTQRQLKNIKIKDFLIVSYDPESYSKEISHGSEICEHIIQFRYEILRELGKHFDLYFHYSWEFRDYEISCYKCLDKKENEWWLSEIMIYLKGIEDFKRSNLP